MREGKYVGLFFFMVLGFVFLLCALITFVCNNKKEIVKMYVMLATKTIRFCTFIVIFVSFKSNNLWFCVGRFAMVLKRF